MIQIVRLGLAVVIVGTIVVLGIAPPVRTFLLGGIYGPGSGRPSATAQPQLQAADAARGQAVYLSKCVGCHAADAHVAPELKGADLRVKYPRDDTLADLIRTGKHPMPQFTQNIVSEQGIVDLVAYLRSKP